MTGFTFSAKQIRSAPAEVRRWIEQEIAAAFRAVAIPAPASAQTPELAACTPEEALRVFELIRYDFAAAQVFLELGREPPIGHGDPVLTRSISATSSVIFASAMIGSPTVSRSFMQVRNDPEATLFGFDQANHVYVHEVTYRSIRRLWEELAQLQSPSKGAAPAGRSEAPFGFVPPVVGVERRC